MIVFEDVSYAYETGQPVLEDLCLTLDSGLVLLLGPNGTGKSTLMKLAAGIERPDSGVITIDGLDLWKQEAAARRRLAYLPEYPDLTPYASVEEILRLVCRLRGRPEAEGIDALSFFELEGDSGRTIRELSLGQRRRAVFAAALVGTAKYILLDEPLAGMDTAIQGRIVEWTLDRVRGGALVLVVSHRAEPFIEQATLLVTIQEGRALVFPDPPADPQERRGLVFRLSRGETSGRR
jgi:ABC-2 type transport system ATP-binding protein